MKIAGVDFEAQGSDALTTRITEAGVRLIDWPGEKGWNPCWLADRVPVSSLVYHPDYAPQTPEIVELTGITDAMLKVAGRPPKEVMPEVAAMIDKADYVIAHNKKYDETLFKAVCTRMGIPIPTTRWLCSIADMPWKARRCHTLSHLALDQGLKMDHRSLHRALDDVDLMLELVTTSFTLEEILDYALSPWVYLQAKIPGPWIGRGGDGGVGKTQAQNLGYGWERAKGTEEPFFPKAWVKRVKEKQVENEIGLASFPVVVLNPKQV